MFFSCSLNKTEIERLTWKYNRGYYLGDFIKLNIPGNIKDTIALSDTVKILILETTKANSFERERLTIQSIKTGELGYYIGIDKRK